MPRGALLASSDEQLRLRGGSRSTPRRNRRGRPIRCLASWACAAVLVFSAAVAGAEERLYGLAAGATYDLENGRPAGVAVAASVTVPAGDDWGGSLGAQGRLLGLITSEGWAVIPSLSGVLSARLGPLEFSLDGGVHIFGVARQRAETIFSIFGVRGGAGLMVQPQPSWRIGVRADLSWLPKSLSSPIDHPEIDANNTYLYVSTMLCLEFRSSFEP